MLRDVLAGDDPQIGSVLRIITHLDADLLLLTNVDFDRGLVALTALAEALRRTGTDYPHLYASAPNTGMQTGADLDRDARLGEPEDAQGYGEFAGQGGMALLSKLPIDHAAALDFAPVLWRDQPGATLPVIGDAAYFDAATQVALLQGGVNQSQRGDPALDTADWPDKEGWPGNLRVDYVLPAAGLNVLDAGVFWPASHDPLSALLGEDTSRASRHAPVWVDLGW